MEQFKAVEKEMKTKAYSKEGLSQNAKQDPKEKEREELCDFLSDQLDEISDFLMTLEREEETLQVAVKKNKRDTAKSERLSDIQTIAERFKWHEGRLQLLLRSLRMT
jgi:CCR4-NOT transcription complex subunit 3